MGLSVKVCGLTRREDVELAVRLGADAIGVVLEPSSPRYVVTPGPLLEAVPPGVERVAVFGPLREADLTGFTAVQMLSGEAPAGLRVFRAVRLRPGMRAEEVLAGVVGADAVVLDAYSEAEYGGSGKTVDWALARSVVELARVPVVLAGGLTPDNVAAAVRAVGPAGVDVSSGVESSPGRKSEEKMAAFFSALAPFR